MAYKSYSDLKVWNRAMDLTDEIYRLVRKLPREELYGLSDQMRRAAVSVPSNIAEGKGRQSNNEFRKFLLFANGSCLELQTQLLICVRQKYLSEKDVEPALTLSDEVNRMLTSLILYLAPPSDKNH